MAQKPRLIIYHGGECWDGLASAWLLRQFAPWGKEAEYIAAQYDGDAPEVAGRHVMIVDFSYRRDILEQMKAEAASLLVLDHHKAAAESLRGLPYVVYRSDMSGVGLVWQWLHTQCQEYLPASMPLFCQYIQDRDLWLWEMEHSRLVSARMRSFTWSFETLNYWFTFGESAWKSKMWIEGQTVLQAQEKTIERHARHAVTTVIAGIPMPIVNCTLPELASELGHELAKTSESGAAAYFFVKENGTVIVSLRSVEEGPDVSAIAKQFNGGGHKHAAGYQLTLAGLADLLK